MNLHNYADDPLVKRLTELSAKATPGKWEAKPKRLVINGVQGPMMSYLCGSAEQPEGMKVSLGSERIADHEFVAALVNAWRTRALYCILNTEAQPYAAQHQEPTEGK